MDHLIKNHFIHTPIKVHEPKFTEKIYNSFSRASKDGPGLSAPLFSRGKVNDELRDISFDDK